MIRLVQTFGTHTGRVVSFSQPIVRFGRMPDCDVVFDAHGDLDASGRHAELRVESGEHLLLDLGSRNGTWVNGQRIERCVLRRGDEVEFGPGGPRLRVDELTRADAAPAPASAVTVGATPVPVRPAAEATPAGGEAPVRPEAATVLASDVAPGHPTPLPGATTEPDVRYGQRTVQMMIEAAVTQARAGGTPIWLKVAVATSGALLLAAAAVGVAVALRASDEAARPDAAAMLATNAPSIFRVAVLSPSETLCTAFAVRDDLLATSAACVLAVEERQGRGGAVLAQGLVGTLPIVQMWRHPSYEPGSSAVDVGLLQVQGRLGRVVPIATMQKLSGLGAGRAVIAFGFGISEPAIRSYPSEIVGVDELLAPGQRLLYPGALPGGAPLFDQDGDVVGVHSAGVAGPEGRGFGIRADALLGLLAGLGR